MGASLRAVVFPKLCTARMRASTDDVCCLSIANQKKSDADILLELDFMAHLRNHGLPLPAIISSSDHQPLVVCELDQQKWQCVLMEHAQGAHPEAFTPLLLDHMATLQAQMHTLGEQYAKTHKMKSGRAILRETSVTDE